ncbi:MAG: DUF4105 domain-containing protein [Gemmatimonadaceae bacterium]|nr:DUF4105 domain-containing protein [Gemmatimonadaceae bacterium]
MAVAAAGVVQAQASPAMPAPGDTTPVTLVTMGQGDAVWERFGHNALIVPAPWGTPLAYNWGMFDFKQPNFLGRFLLGDTRYWMEPFPVAPMLDAYRADNRTLVAQQLALTPAQRSALVAALAVNAEEANKYYRYDYYRDNCSTRPRDALDAVLGGVLRPQLARMPGTGSYRWHTRRILHDNLPLYFGAQLVLGVDADAPLTAWEEAFLPQSFAASLRRVELPAADGLPVRMLVAREDTIFRAERPPERMEAPTRLPIAMFVGTLLAAALLIVGRGPRGAALAVGGWSTLAVLLGGVLLFAWFLTRHAYMRNNPSVALVHPAWVIGIVAAVACWRGTVSRACWRGTVSRGVRSAMRWLLVVAVVGSAGAALAGHAGSALEMAALFLPAHAAAAFLVDREGKRRLERGAVA